MEQEQDQTDGLAAETRRLLDAATKGDWDQVGATVEKEEDVGWCIVVAECDKVADAALIAAAPRLLANWLAREDRRSSDLTDELAGAELWSASLRANARNGVTSGYSAEATTELAELFDTLHDGIYRMEAERDRLADENRALREREQGLLDAIAGQDPDQCAVCGDVYCSGAYCLEQMVAELPDEHQELPEPIEKVQDMVRLGRILSEWAAADRGTDR